MSEESTFIVYGINGRRCNAMMDLRNMLNDSVVISEVFKDRIVAQGKVIMKDAYLMGKEDGGLRPEGIEKITPHAGHTLKLCDVKRMGDLCTKYFAIRCLDCQEMLYTFKEE